MAKELSTEKILSSLDTKETEDLLTIQKKVVQLISQHEKEAEQKIETEKAKLDLIRGGGK